MEVNKQQVAAMENEIQETGLSKESDDAAVYIKIYNQKIDYVFQL